MAYIILWSTSWLVNVCQILGCTLWRVLLAYLDLFCELWVDERIKLRFFLFFFFLLSWDGIFFLLRFGLLCVQAWSFSFVVGVGCGIFDSDPEAPATDEPRPLVGEPPLAGCARNIRAGWRVPSSNELRCALYAVDAHKVQYW